MNNFSPARVGISCSPKYLWATENSTGTTWHSTDITLLKNIYKHLNMTLQFFQYELSYNTSNFIFEGTILYKKFQSLLYKKSFLILSADLKNNYIDFVPHLWYQTHERYQYADFSILATGMPEQTRFILPKLAKDRRILTGVFDAVSSRLILVSFILMSIMMAWMNKINIYHSSLNVFALFTQQNTLAGGKNNFRHSGTSKAYYLLNATMLTFLTSMYCSVIISILSTETPGIKIESLEELAIKHKSLRIHATKSAKWEIEHSNYASELLNRLDFVDFFFEDNTNAEQTFHSVIENVLAGTHVYLRDKNDFQTEHSLYLNDEARLN